MEAYLKILELVKETESLQTEFQTMPIPDEETWKLKIQQEEQLILATQTQDLEPLQVQINQLKKKIEDEELALAFQQEESTEFQEAIKHAEQRVTQLEQNKNQVYTEFSNEKKRLDDLYHKLILSNVENRNTLAKSQLQASRKRNSRSKSRK